MRRPRRIQHECEATAKSQTGAVASLKPEVADASALRIAAQELCAATAGQTEAAGITELGRSIEGEGAMKTQCGDIPTSLCRYCITMP
jgi:hypothetical protein